MKRIVLVIVFCDLLLLGACSGERVELENTVRAYNELNSRAVAEGNALILGFFASEREMNRVRAYITQMQAEGRRLRGTLEEMEFLGAETEAGRATVRSRESWRYQFVDSRTGAALTRPQEMHFVNTYTLIRLDDRWVVDRISSSRGTP